MHLCVMDSGSDPDDGSCSSARFECGSAACLRRRNQNITPAIMPPSPTTPTATPIPAWAPVDNVASSPGAADSVADTLGSPAAARVVETTASDEVGVAVGALDVVDEAEDVVLNPKVF